MTETAKCELCGEPMPPGEQMFKFHGYSGPCPKPAEPRQGKAGDWKDLIDGGPPYTAPDINVDEMTPEQKTDFRTAAWVDYLSGHPEQVEPIRRALSAIEK